MNNNPLSVSVIIPVYNAERYLSAAIESVLTQSRLPLEIIVIDDGSTDESKAVARRFVPMVCVIAQPNQGPAAARNRGVALAQGNYLAFLDADDLWVADKLQRQLLALAADPALAMVFGQVEQFYSPELLPAGAPAALGQRQVLAGLHVGAMLIRHAAFTQIGPFDPQLQAAEFIEWYGRAQALGLKSMLLPDLVMRRRIHTTNLGVRAPQLLRREYLRLAQSRAARHAGQVIV